jgi:hypothetical protein
MRLKDQGGTLVMTGELERFSSSVVLSLSEASVDSVVIGSLCRIADEGLVDADLRA